MTIPQDWVRELGKTHRPLPLGHLPGPRVCFPAACLFYIGSLGPTHSQWISSTSGRQVPTSPIHRHPLHPTPYTLRSPKRNPFKTFWGLKPGWEGLVPHRANTLWGQCTKIRLVLFVFVFFILFCFLKQSSMRFVFGLQP